VSAPVFIAESAAGRALVSLGAGAVFVLDGAEGRHAGVVQRRRAGERIDVVDGSGTRVHAVIEHVERDTVTVRVESVDVEPAPSPRLVLVQALAKGDRDELAIEAATEVGADAIVPWQAERSVVVWRGDRAEKSRARWVATVRAAAKQSRRAWLPDVEAVVDTRGLVTRVAEVVSSGGVALVLHEEATASLGTVALPEPSEPGPAVTDAAVLSPVDVLVVVGPEGGISDAELARIVDAGAQAVRLGPHVLRTSTAGPIALALLCERSGRWG
jgi:16S rRNA (uracil1498-N3)-methyltransferase